MSREITNKMPTPNRGNIAAHLPVMAQDFPDMPAVIVQGPRRGDGTYSYKTLTASELDMESNRLARGLQSMGISQGVRTVLMVTPSIAFFTLTFALFKAGAVPVMVDPGMGIKNLKKCLAEASPEAFVGIPKAHAARLLLGWGRGSVGQCVTVGPRLFWGGKTIAGIRSDDPSPVLSEVEPDGLAAILFTSGSTGLPKGAVYTHTMFQAQVCALRDHYGIEPGERDLATFPLFALFGPALGMATVVPRMDASRPITADPRNLVAAIHDQSATNLFASPALIEVIGRYGAEQGVKLDSLRRVISAGAPATSESVRRFVQLLPAGVEIHTSYGATEALPVASIGSQELLGETARLTEEGAGVCVGRPAGDVQIHIIKIDDGPIREWSESLVMPEGEIGEICVAGPAVSPAYYERPESTALAKIADPESSRFFHRMGDVGYMDAEGRLWFCGRKAHRVEAAGKTYFTIPCERIFNTHAGVRRSALVGIRLIGKMVPALCIERDSGDSEGKGEGLKKELRARADAHLITQGIETFLFHDGFPMDVRHNAKIFREKLAVWAQEQLG
jgi:acyl-CoA synthetase (AMP-forming)/AMP-acid ligase II